MARHDTAPEGAPDGRDRRITIADARKILGMIGRNYDDAEIVEILDCLYGIAEESYDAYRDGEADE